MARWIDMPGRTESAAPTNIRRDRALYRLAMFFAITPIISSAVQNGISDWFPTHDAAYTTVWIRDVFSAHTPLHGQPMRFPTGAADVPYYLGVVHQYFLAVPVELFGVSWGLLIGMALLNSIWVITALWLLRRRVGYRWGLIGCVTVTMLIWSLGSQMLIDPTPVRTGPLAFFAFCVASWSVADGDSRALIPLACTASYLFLTHPQYVLVVPVPAAIAVVIALVRLRRERADAPEGWAQVRRSFVRGAAGACATTVVLWLPAIIDQVFHPGGNIRVWFDSMLSQSGRSGKGLLDTIRVVSSPLTEVPFWFRDSIGHPGFTSGGPIGDAAAQFVTLAVVGVVVVSILVTARRRSDNTVMSGLAIGIVAWIAWVSTIYRQPGNRFVRAYLVTSWPLAAFITTMVVLGIARSVWVRAHLRGAIARRRAGVLLVGAAGVCTLLAIPTVDFGTSTTRKNVAAANHIRRGIRARVARGAPVLVVAGSYPPRTFLPVAILELEDRGIPVRVSPGRDTILYRSFRGLKRARPAPGRRLSLRSTPLPSSPGRALIAAGGTPLREPVDTYLDRTRALQRWAGSTGLLSALPPVREMPPRLQPIGKLLTALRGTDAADRESLFGSSHFVHSLISIDDALAAGGKNLATELGVPGMTNAQLRTWLRDRAVVLDGGHYWVYLEPL